MNSNLYIDDKCLCSQQYATIKNKNDFYNINEKINKTLKKYSKDYVYKYFRESDF